MALLPGLGCAPERRLRIGVAPDPLTQQIASKLVEVFLDADIEVEIVPGEGSVANLESLQRGDADLTIVENNAPYRRDVRTVVPLYQGVLHVLHERGESPSDAFELFRGRTVFAGEPGSMGRWFLRLITSELGVSQDAYSLVASLDDSPQVVFLFRPISPQVTRSIENRYEFFSIGDPSELGRGAIVEGLALEHPQMEPFVIPARTYGRANPEAVLTASVATLLVGREELPAPLVYDLIQAVVDHKQELATVHPSLFTGIRDAFDADGLNFPLHAGGRDYLARDEPGLLERYAELAGVSFSVTIAVLSGLIAVTRWRERVKKNRIDGYYAKVLKVRAASLEYASDGAFAEAIEQVRTIEQEAFRELIDERVAADESFRIFIGLANDTIAELERRQGSKPRAKSLKSVTQDF
jgi:TRAP-type uncharacterized transport system substrate-binding protein